MFDTNFIKAFLFFMVAIVCSCNNPQRVPVNYTDTIVEQENPPPPPGILPGKHMPPPQDIKQIDGIVINYAANKDDDIDKLIIISNNDSLLFHFPPHTAKLLLTIALKNTAVYIWYTNGRKPPKHNDNKPSYELIAVQSKVSNKNIDVHDVPPPPPETGKEITLTSNKTEWQNNDVHNNNLIVSGKLIALPPHAKENLMPLIKNAHSILIKGYERSTANGFVNMSGLTLVRPFAVTIDSTNYLIR